MSPLYLRILALITLFSACRAVSLPQTTNNALRAPGAIPLPPSPTQPPIGPDRYPIGDTSYSLRVRRPWGETLPHNPTIRCLMLALAELDRQIASQGDAWMLPEWTFEDGGIKIVILNPFKHELSLHTTIFTLRGFSRMLLEYPQYGTRAGATAILNDFSPLGAIELSRSQTPVVGGSPLKSNHTGSSSVSATTEALNPKDYRVPDSSVTVSIDGRAPYGPPLPEDEVIMMLAKASEAAYKMEREEEEEVLPGLWRFEQGSVGIDVYTYLSVDCEYSTLDAGLLGLFDLMTEPGGIGAVAAGFVIKEDGKGQVARGKLKNLGPQTPRQMATMEENGTLIEERPTATVTRAVDAVITGDIETA